MCPYDENVRLGSSNAIIGFRCWWKLNISRHREFRSTHSWTSRWASTALKRPMETVFSRETRKCLLASPSAAMSSDLETTAMSGGLTRISCPAPKPDAGMSGSKNWDISSTLSSLVGFWVGWTLSGAMGTVARSVWQDDRVGHGSRKLSCDSGSKTRFSTSNGAAVRIVCPVDTSVRGCAGGKVAATGMEDVVGDVEPVVVIACGWANDIGSSSVIVVAWLIGGRPVFRPLFLGRTYSQLRPRRAAGQRMSKLNLTCDHNTRCNGV